MTMAQIFIGREENRKTFYGGTVDKSKIVFFEGEATIEKRDRKKKGNGKTLILKDLKTGIIYESLVMAAEAYKTTPHVMRGLICDVTKWEIVKDSQSKTKKKVKDKSTGKIYPSILYAARDTGIGYFKISKSICDKSYKSNWEFVK